MNIEQKTKSVMVVAAHPDDEILGCGGTLARYIHQGARVTILLLGEGPTARKDNKMDNIKRDASASAAFAAECLGISDLQFAALPDNMFDTIPLLHIIQTIEQLAALVKPDVVLTHHAGDMNQDHRITHQAVMTAFRPLPGTQPVTVLGFEVLSSTEYVPAHTAPVFAPTVFVNIEDFLEAKQTALAAYGSEMRPWPHPRSAEAVAHLAALRGCSCGCSAAEAFVLYRSVWL